MATYTYDALDRLRTVERGGSRIRFRYQGTTTAVAQVVDDIGGSVIRNVATGPDDTVLEDWLGTGRRLYGSNGHHETTWTADDTGAVTATLRSDPWGNVLRSTGTLPDWRFQGSWYDTATDLSWAVARWYSPVLGAFISEDTLLGEPEQPASRHLLASSTTVADDYAYDGNDSRTLVVEDNGAGAVTRHYCYDARNQLVGVYSVAGCGSGVLESYAYDAAGNRTSAAGRTFSYTAAGQLESCSGTACAPVFDADGRLTRITAASGTWSYLYDAEGRLTSACNSTSSAGSGFAANAHHIFPQQFEARFRMLGINIHEARYGTWWPTASHQVEAYVYNRVWGLFLATRPSRSQVLLFGRIISRAFGLRLFY